MECMRSILQTLINRLGQLLADAPPGSLQITGVLGLAAVLYGIYHFQGPARSKRNLQHRRQDQRGGSSGASSSGGRQQTAGVADGPRHSETSASRPSDITTMKDISWGVRSHLGGVKSVTISAPGVLLEECSASELQDAATLKQEAARVLGHVAQHASVYVIAQVEDDTGEATCRGALEAAGLVGSKPGQIPAHRLLFCSTLDGKVSIVRQLEPQLHIDSHPKTVEDLKRFIRLVHIREPDQPSAGLGSPNVGYADSFEDLFSPR